MTEKVNAMRCLMAKKILDASTAMFDAQNEEQIFSVAEDLDQISMFIKHTLFAELKGS